MAANDTLAGSYSGLVEAARHFVNAMTVRLNAGVYPTGSNEDNEKRGLSTIQDATYISDVTRTPGGDILIQVIIDSIRAPFALAYEYGSGIHATIGAPNKYRIAPKNATHLVFPWSPANRVGAYLSPKTAFYVPEAGDGGQDLWFFNYVDHPGVEAKPFMKPTVQAEQGAIVDIIGKELMKSIKMAIGEDVTFEVTL